MGVGVDLHDDFESLHSTSNRSTGPNYGNAAGPNYHAKRAGSEARSPNPSSIHVGIKAGGKNSIHRKVSVSHVLETDSDYHRAVVGEEFVLSSAQSNVDTVRQLSSHHRDNDDVRMGEPPLQILAGHRNSDHEPCESPVMSPLKSRLSKRQRSLKGSAKQDKLKLSSLMALKDTSEPSSRKRVTSKIS